MPTVCPNCGAALKRGARFCRECGSDEKTGWKSAADVNSDSVELPEEQDYGEFLQSEGLAPRRVRKGRRWLLVAGIVLVLALTLTAIL